MTNNVVTVIGFSLLATVAMSPVACTINRHNRIAEAIKAGGDPQAVRCAIEAESGINADCLLIASKQGDRK